MYVTTTEIMKNLKEKYQCPREFMMEMRSSGVFRNMKSALIADEEDDYDQLEEDFFECYKDFCDLAKLDINEDNRRKSTHVYWHLIK